MRKVRRKRYGKTTLSSSVVGLVGVFELVMGIIMMLAGVGFMSTPPSGTEYDMIMQYLGGSIGIMAIVMGAVVFFNGALFMAISESVGFSKQNNGMLKDLMEK